MFSERRSRQIRRRQIDSNFNGPRHRRRSPRSNGTVLRRGRRQRLHGQTAGAAVQQLMPPPMRSMMTGTVTSIASSSMVPRPIAAHRRHGTTGRGADRLHVRHPVRRRKSANRRRGSMSRAVRMIRRRTRKAVLLLRLLLLLLSAS